MKSYVVFTQHKGWHLILPGHHLFTMVQLISPSLAPSPSYCEQVDPFIRDTALQIIWIYQ